MCLVICPKSHWSSLPELKQALAVMIWACFKMTGLRDGSLPWHAWHPALLSFSFVI